MEAKHCKLRYSITWPKVRNTTLAGQKPAMNAGNNIGNKAGNKAGNKPSLTCDRDAVIFVFGGGGAGLGPLLVFPAGETLSHGRPGGRRASAEKEVRSGQVRRNTVPWPSRRPPGVCGERSGQVRSGQEKHCPMAVQAAAGRLQRKRSGQVRSGETLSHGRPGGPRCL